MIIFKLFLKFILQNYISSFSAHTLVTEESHNLGLCDFPIENLPALVKLINNAPNLPLYDAIYRLYPYKSFLTKEGMGSVEDTLQNFQLNQGSSLLSKITNGNVTGDGKVDVLVGNQSHRLPVPVGTRQDVKEASEKRGKYVEIPYHESLLAELALSHAVHDFCIIGNYNT